MAPGGNPEPSRSRSCHGGRHPWPSLRAQQAPETPKGNRSNGEGSIYLNDGRWRGAIIWTDPDGVQHRKTFAAKLQGTVKEPHGSVPAGP